MTGYFWQLFGAATHKVWKETNNDVISINNSSSTQAYICPMHLTLRYATREDAALVADVSQQTFYDTFAADNSPENMEKFLNEQFTKGKLMLEVGSPENTFLLAYADNQVAGYLKLREGKKLAALQPASTLEIARLYVVKNYIGKGVGKRLMQAAIDIAEEKEKDIVWLGVWEHNHRAIAFYTSWGFQKFDEVNFLLGDDLQRDWLMKKEINRESSNVSKG